MLNKIMLLLVCLTAMSYAMPFVSDVSRQDTSAVDTVKAPQPDYTGVNVIVETEWGTTDKTENVDVYIRKEKGKHFDIVMKKSDHQECIVELVSGMVVKIVSRKTGKILKTYKP